jgi:putative membrane protein
MHILALAEPLTRPEYQAFASGFPILLLHAVVTLGLLAAGAMLYALLSPWKEVAQIRLGNPAASIAFSGILLGLAIPLAVSLSVSTSFVDVVIWGAATVVMQLLVFRLVDLILTGLPNRVAEGEVSAAALLLSGRLASSMVMAAALTG